jgi:hypothetical protein
VCHPLRHCAKVHRVPHDFRVTRRNLIRDGLLEELLHIKRL